MKQRIISLIIIIISIFSGKNIYSLLAKEIAKTEIFAVRYYKRKTLILKAHRKVKKANWPYLKHYWKVFYNEKNKVIAETLFVRGRRIAYYSYKYLSDGRIVKKGYHWGGIRGRVYYDMGWKNHVLKRGYSYYNSRYAYEVYNKQKKLVYREYYINGRFYQFERYYFDNYGNHLKVVRSHKKHLRGSYYDYLHSGKPVLPYSTPRKSKENE